MPSVDDLQQMERELSGKLRKVRRVLGRDERTEQERDVERKRRKREYSRNVDIPPCADRERRETLEAEDKEWLRFYFGPGCGVHEQDTFWYPFTSQQQAMIRIIRNAIRYGGDQSMAASRGEGKTTLFERLLLKYTLQGVISFSVLCAATGSLADNSLDSIKTALEENDRLHADYPEVCVPVRALENAPNRAHYQLVSGDRHDNGERYEKHPSKFTWCGQEIVLPNVLGSPSARAIIATRGLDAAVRGLKKKGRRPDVVGIDDPDTEETVRSEDQAKKLEDRIDKALAGLGSQRRPVARVMLTTIQTRSCVSYKYTDPKQKPTWKGRRFRFLLKPPAREDLWDEYAQLTAAGYDAFAHGTGDDEYAREAHKFYLAHREEMDAGAEVANAYRFNDLQLPDGSQVEVSAVQHYHNAIARTSRDAVQAEYDNDPPEETGILESSITPYRIQTQRSGYERRQVPNACTVLVQGIDVGKFALHWTVRAWQPDGIGYTIDYGVQDVHNTFRGTDEGVDTAIHRALTDRMNEAKDQYTREDGEPMEIGLTLIDARYRKQAVLRACREIGLGIKPAMGHGKCSGCVSLSFRDVLRRTNDRKPGDGWFETRDRSGLWILHMNTERWKAYEHDRWMTPPGTAGAMHIFGEQVMAGHQERAHKKETHAYSHSICNEKEVEEIVKGVLKRYWKVFGPNHWLDASYMTDVAANIMGVRIPGEPTRPVVGIVQTVPLAEMAKA